MAAFATSREKQMWHYALLTWAAILATLTFGRPLQQMLRDQNVQAVFFLTGMLLTGVAIFAHGLQVKPDKRELAVWAGLAAVFLMVVFRLGAPERSHLIEYSVLAIFIHQALQERLGNEVLKTALIAFVLTACAGVLDEITQLLLPNRVFDVEDIIFNCIAAFIAITGGIVLQWTRQCSAKNKT